MKLFTSKYNDKKDIYMATRIVEELGEEKVTTYSELKCNHLVYENYGFKITKRCDIDENIPHICIMFNGTTVLNDKIYIPGLWEKTLYELYKYVCAIQKEKIEDENAKRDQIKILNVLNELLIEGNLNVKNAIKIKAIKDTNKNGDYFGTTYNIYENGKLVFKAYKGTSDNRKFYVYFPGQWEKVLDNYYKKYQQKINEQKQVESDNLALENIGAIKTLRKNLIIRRSNK